MMDEDIIVVDDESADVRRIQGTVHEPTSTVVFGQSAPPIAEVPGASVRTSSRLRGASTASVITPSASGERQTRSARHKSLKLQAPKKLKLKLSEKATAAQASGTSFLGPYDRELDSDDEDLAFEEQFILRMPPGDDCERLKKVVTSREVAHDIWFKFKDSRRAVFHIGNGTYSAKLVDLPCIIEAQKTLDNKQMFKVADICQMLVVENRIDSEDAVGQQKSFNVDEFIWPHGITPPLHHVRKRRFRKRVNRRTIETVEQEVERLLEADALATQVRYDVLDNVNPDLSDSEFIEREETVDPMTPGFMGSDAGDAPTPMEGLQGEDGEDEEGDGEIDEELAAELDLALGDEADGDDDDEDEEDQSEEEEDEEEDEDDDEGIQSRRLLNEEIKDLEAAVTKKNHEIASSANPLIKRRFEDALKKLQADLDMKLAQKDEIKEQQRLRKAGIATHREDSEANEMDGGLFGSQDVDGAMDIG